VNLAKYSPLTVFATFKSMSLLQESSQTGGNLKSIQNMNRQQVSLAFNFFISLRSKELWVLFAW